jgi:hypothetical protein
VIDPDFTGFQNPGGLALDSAGNIFVADFSTNLVEEIVAAGGYATVKTLGNGNGNFNKPVAVALDPSGNLFVVDQGNAVIKEMTAASGYSTVATLPATVGQLLEPGGLKVDASGNIFVADTDHRVVKEVLAAGGYSTIKPIGFALNGGPVSVALDTAANVFVLDIADGAVREIPAAGGYVTEQVIVEPGVAFDFPQAIAADRNGNLFVADSDNGEIEEIPNLGPTVLAASILPNARSVQTGSAATVFATMINSGSTPVSGCSVTQDNSYFSLTYQTTDPATNALTGTPNTPAQIPAGGLQTFLLSFTVNQSGSTSAPDVPHFACDNTAAAMIFPNINTVYLDFEVSPPLDVIALSATASNDGTLHVANGVGAFAVATVNAGAEGSANLSVDTGTATLPTTVTICQTNASGQCQAPPAASVSVDFLAGATPTFSVFVGANGAIPFDPIDSRIFVRSNAIVLSSVAVTTD